MSPTPRTMAPRIMAPRTISAWCTMALGAAFTTLGCSTAEDGKSSTASPTGVLAAPVTGQAWAVGDAVNRTCGTLDCHGSKLRNLRVYGYGSLRFDTSTLPGTGATTDKEYEQTYRALVGLEPEQTAAVIREKQGTNRLSLIRKGHGLDNHKGGNRMPAGGAMEKCLISWLVSQTEVGACNEAAGYTETARTTDAGTGDAGR
jgi:hypothetical protein